MPFSLFHGYLLISILSVTDGPAAMLGEFGEAFTTRAACQSFLKGKDTHARMAAIIADLRERGVMVVQVATTCMDKAEEQRFLEDAWGEQVQGEPGKDI